MKNQVHLFFHLAGVVVVHQVIQATHVVVVAVGKDNGVQSGEIDAQDLGIFQEQVAEAGVEEDLFASFLHIKAEGRFPLEVHSHQGVVVHQNSDFHHGSSFE